MKRWLPWFLLPLITIVLVIAGHSTNANLLRDSDTKVLLENIRERNDPLAWFSGDWPLYNHFYRPISTLAFEMDNALHGSDAAGYGLTNALIAALCIGLSFWMLRELTNRPWLAGFGSGLFGLWHLRGPVNGWIQFVLAAMAGVCLLGFLRKDHAPARQIFSAVFVLLFASAVFKVAGGEFADRIVHWLPGRTASVMTIFTLASVAAYARYERITAGRKPMPEAKATDVPSTKGTEVVQAGKWTWLWLVWAFVDLVLALMSYEQAVMLPAILLGTAILFSLSGRKPNWWVHIGFWVVLGGYMVMRSRILPSEVSGYQQQQFRDGIGVYLSIGDYGFPLFNWGQQVYISITAGILVLMTLSPWALMSFITGNIVAHVQTWKSNDRWLMIAMLLMSLISFLPMAWLKYFGHYLYWPSAFWAAYCVLLVALGGKLAINAVSPRAIPTPPRSDPAPGSLPRL
ncbi:MAG: hypothetical protein KDC26_00570 [Armatimonadetes bacterium]|nr:hypothetical protein [Armatimonadota bacterium]